MRKTDAGPREIRSGLAVINVFFFLLQPDESNLKFKRSRCKIERRKEGRSKNAINRHYVRG